MTLGKLLVLKLIGLGIGCVAKFTTGSLFVFAVYQNAIKDTFNYTQREVEVFSSMLNIGLGFGFLPGMFYDRFGPQWTSALGLVISVPAYMLIWSTAKYVKFYSANSWLMAVYFFCCGMGSVFTYMVAINTNIINFHAKHSGKIIGFLNAFFAGSPSIYSVIYYQCFTHGDITDTSNQDFPGFMVMFAVSFAVADLLCIVFLRIYKEDVSYVEFENVTETEQPFAGKGLDAVAKNDPGKEIEKEESVNASRETQRIKEPINETENTENLMTLKQLIKCYNYHLLVLMFSFASVIGLVYVNNITVISKSLHLNSNDNTLTIIIPITNAILSACVGLFSDYFKERIPRLWVVLLGCSVFTASQVLVYLFADKLAILVLSTIFVGIGVAIIWSIGPTIMKEMFHIGNFGRNWGLAILVAAVLGACSQEVFGVLYDNQITEKYSQQCYGMKCIRGGTAMEIACGSLSIVFGLLLQLMGRRRRR